MLLPRADFRLGRTGSVVWAAFCGFLAIARTRFDFAKRDPIASAKGWISERLIATAYVLSVLAIVFVGSLAYYVMERMSESEAWVPRTERAIAKIEQLHQSLVSAESAGRAFIISGDRKFKEEYDDRRRTMHLELSRFKEFISDNKLQRDLAEQLDIQIDIRFAYLTASIELRNTNGFAALEQKPLGHGAREMQKMQATIEQIKEEEKKLLAERVDLRKEQNRLLKWGLAFLMLMCSSRNLI